MASFVTAEKNASASLGITDSFRYFIMNDKNGKKTENKEFCNICTYTGSNIMSNNGSAHVILYWDQIRCAILVNVYVYYIL